MRILVAAWIGSANVGDELLFAALVAKLRRLGIDDITAISRSPTETAARYGVDSVSSGDLPGILRAIREADGLVFGGGGLIQDASSIWNIPHHFSRLWLARLLGLPIVGIGLGAGPLGSMFARSLTRWTLGGFRQVVVRDEASAALLRGLGVPRVVTSADLALSLPRPALTPEPVISVNLRPAPPGRGLLPVSMRRRVAGDGEAVDAIATALDVVVERAGLPLRFLGFEPGRDDELARVVNSRLRNGPFEVVNVEPDTVVEWIARGRLTIATRFHAGICSVVAGRAMVLIGYAPKVRALAGAFPGSARLVTDDAAGLAAIPDHVEQLLASGALPDVNLAPLLALESANDRAIAAFLDTLRGRSAAASTAATASIRLK